MKKTESNNYVEIILKDNNLTKNQKAEIINFIYNNYNKKLEEDLRKIRSNTIEKAEIIIAKNRNGAVDTIKVQYNKPLTRFEDKADERDEAYATTITRLEINTDKTLYIALFHSSYFKSVIRYFLFNVVHIPEHLFGLALFKSYDKHKLP